MLTQQEQDARAQEPLVEFQPVINPKTGRLQMPVKTGHATEKFIGWELDQLGAGIIYKFYAGDEGRPIEKTRTQQIIEFPFVADIFGRYAKVTRQGEIERDRALAQGVKSEVAYRAELEQQAVRDALDAYWKGPSNQQTIGRQEQMGTQLAKELYPRERDEDTRNENEKRLQGRVALSVLRHTADPLINPVLSVSRNEDKATVIAGARPNFASEAEFNVWLRTATRYHIISPEVIELVHKRLRRPLAATVH